MEQHVKLTRAQYEALASLARRGPADPVHLDEFLRKIEKDNNIQRYQLRIRWQEMDTPMPPNVDYPREWPPTQESSLSRIDRPIARMDVDAEIARLATNPVGITVTRDPQGLVGWTQLEKFFPDDRRQR